MLSAGGRLRPVSSRTTIVAIVAAFALGWLAATGWAAVSGSDRVSLQGDDGGTVTFVNVDGSKFCFTSERDGQEHCGAAYKASAVDVGQRVEVTVTRVPLRPNVAELYWIVTTPPSR
jgi:hypothetical protein